MQFTLLLKFVYVAFVIKTITAVKRNQGLILNSNITIKDIQRLTVSSKWESNRSHLPYRIEPVGNSERGIENTL